MAIIENDDNIVHAVLTNKGKQLLYQNNERFIISHFALTDDEIIYSLANGTDDSFTNIQSLSVFEPSTSNLDFKNKLIRQASDNQSVAINNQINNIPPDVMQIAVKTNGSATLSLQSYLHDYVDITFSIYNPQTQSYFLSNSFLIDSIPFYIKYNKFYFKIQPIAPSTNSINASTLNYWYNADTSSTYRDINNNDVFVSFGIDTNHKSVDGDTLSNYVNGINIPAITFRISLPEEVLKNTFSYMMNQNVTTITEFITIVNNDTTLIPHDSFYGINSVFSSLLTKIPITITF